MWIILQFWRRPLLTFVDIFGEVESEGDGEAAEEEDGGCDPRGHHTLPAGLLPARALHPGADDWK